MKRKILAYDKESGKAEKAMIILLLALISTAIIMITLMIGKLGFGRSEPFNTRKFVNWFIRYFIFIC